MTQPIYIFEVITYNLSDVLSYPQPDELTNILFGLDNRTIWLETIDRSMKHGDQFAVSGAQARYLKALYVDVDQPSLKIVEIPVVTTDDLVMGPASSDTLGFISPMSLGVVGTIVSSATTVTDYGFVWAEHDSPTLEDNVESVGSDSIGEFATTISSLPYPATIYCAAYASNSFGTVYGNVLNGEVMICLAAGTKISLTNGEKKNIEDITYDDDLLVWDFDENKFNTSKPVWMVKPFESSQYSVIKFNNGTELKTVADGRGHRIFNVNKGMFTFSMNEDTPLETKAITSQQEIIHVIDKEVVVENTTFYNIITHTHFNMFANDILTSTGLNNIYPIVDMKFVKNEQETFSAEDFKDISSDIVSGLRLLEQPVNYPDLKKKIDSMLSRQLCK